MLQLTFCVVQLPCAVFRNGYNMRRIDIESDVVDTRRMSGQLKRFRRLLVLSIFGKTHLHHLRKNENDGY